MWRFESKAKFYCRGDIISRSTGSRKPRLSMYMCMYVCMYVCVSYLYVDVRDSRVDVVCVRCTVGRAQ